MTKSLFNFILTIVLAYILCQFLDWYSVMIAAFLTALLIPLKRIAVFLMPFLAILIFWSVYSFILSSPNDFIMAKKIAVLLPLSGNAYLLMLVTGIIGGIAAGIAGIFGKQVSMIFK